MMCFQRSGVFLVGINRRLCPVHVAQQRAACQWESETEPTRCPDEGCAGRQHLNLQRKFPRNHATPATVPPIVHEMLRSPGLPLDPRHTLSSKPRVWTWLQPDHRIPRRLHPNAPWRAVPLIRWHHRGEGVPISRRDRAWHI